MFASATVISGSSSTVYGSNVGATKEVGEPPKAGNSGGASVWWFWTAPASGSVTISTMGSSFDTIMGIFTGSSVSALTCVAYNDDSPLGGTMTSRVTFNAVVGTRYAIGVDGYNGITGNITLAVSQAGSAPPPCTYALSAPSASIASSGGSGGVGVTTGTGCSWTASSGASWVSITAGASGSGNGTVSYSVAGNTSSASRSGTLTIAGQTFTVSQSGASSCTYALSATSATVAASGGSGSVNVTSGTGCGWTASSGASWITITGGGSGSGSGTVSYSVAANTSSSSRSGTLTIASKTFTVSQSGAGCSYAISPTSTSFPSSGGSGSVTVTATPGCVWVSTSGASWITINSSTGTGNGTVSYSVAANTSTSSRSGTITVAGNQTFTVSQAAAATSSTIGQLQWLVNSSTTQQANVNSTRTDSSGNVVVAGSFWGTVDFGGTILSSGGPEGGFVAKYNSQGALQWAKALEGGTGSDLAAAVAVDSQNNIVVAGTFCSQSINFGTGPIANNGYAYGADVFVAKFSPSGTAIWAKGFGAISADGLANGTLAVDSGNNVFVASQSAGTVNFGGGVTLTTHGNNDIMLAKFSAATGAIMWVKTYGGALNDLASGLAVDRWGDVVVTGHTDGGDLGGGISLSGGLFVVKYAGLDGSYRWAKTVAGPTSYAVTTDPTTGNVIVTGQATSTSNFGSGNLYGGAFLAAYDPSGNYLWATSYSGNAGYGVVADGSGLLAFTGQANGWVNLGGGAILNAGYFVATYNISGGSPVYRWSKGASGSNTASFGCGVAFDTLGHVLTGGAIQGTANLGGATATGPTSPGAAFVIQYDK